MAATTSSADAAGGETTPVAAQLAGLVTTRMRTLRETEPQHQLRFLLQGNVLQDDHFDVFALQLNWQDDEKAKNINYIAFASKYDICNIADVSNSLEKWCALYADMRDALKNRQKPTYEKYRRVNEFMTVPDDIFLVLYIPQETESDPQALYRQPLPKFSDIFELEQGSVRLASEDDPKWQSALTEVDNNLQNDIMRSLILVNSQMNDLDLKNLSRTALKKLLRQEKEEERDEKEKDKKRNTNKRNKNDKKYETDNENMKEKEKKEWSEISATILMEYLRFLQQWWWEEEQSPLSETSNEIRDIVRDYINGHYKGSEGKETDLGDLQLQLTNFNLSYIIVEDTPPRVRCSLLKQAMEKEKLRYLIVGESILNKWRQTLIMDLTMERHSELVLCVSSIDDNFRVFVSRVKSNKTCNIRIISPSFDDEMNNFVQSLKVRCGTLITPSQSTPAMNLKRLQDSVTTDGPTYEFKVAALLALRAKHQDLKFRLFTNVDCARPWDDLVLRVDEPCSVVYLIQLKHSRKAGLVGTKAFLGGKDGNKNYNLRKYFDWFQKFHEKCNQKNKLEDDGDWWLCSWEDKLQFIIYTNNKVQHSSSTSTSNSEKRPFESLLVTKDASNVFSFRGGDEAWNLFNDELYRRVFLPRLHVLGSQAHVDDLDSLMVKELNCMYEKPLKRAERNVERYIKRFQHWAERTSEGSCVTESSGELEEVMAEDLRDRAREAAEEGAFTFEEEHCTALRDALLPLGTISVSVPGVPMGHRVAKLQQVLDKDFSNKWVYIDAKISRTFSKKALEAACSVCDVVVFDAMKKTESLEDLYAAVKGRVKRVVLLDSGIENKVSGIHDQKPFSDNWKLKELNVEAKNSMMERTLKFQGKPLKLTALQSSWPSLEVDVDGALLSSLVHCDAEMGHAPLSADDDLVHHVPRTIVNALPLSRDVLQLNSPKEHLVFHVVSPKDVRWTELEQVEYESALLKEFQDACASRNASHPEGNIHLVERVDQSLLWRASQRDPTALAKFVLSDSDNRAVSGRVNLLLGEPGIGKSSFLQSLAAEAREKTPSAWAVVVKLLDHANLLEGMPEEMSLWEVVDLVTTAATGSTGPQVGAARRSVEAALLHSGAIHIFVDGVNEISPALEGKAERLLQLLTQTKAATIWVASRLEVGLSLRHVLRCAPWRLLPLSPSEQVEYLRRRLASEEDLAKKTLEGVTHIPCNGNQHNSATSRKIESDLNDSDALRTLLSVPLHLRMAAEVYIENAKVAKVPQLFKSLFTDISQLDLLELFIHKESKRCTQMYGVDRAAIKSTNFSLEDDDVFHLVHQHYAMFLWTAAFPKYRHHFGKVNTQKTGVLRIRENGQPQFTHYMFFEYFVADWMYKNFENPKSSETKEPTLGREQFLEAAFKRRSRSNVLFFLDLKLAKGLPLHNAVLMNDADAFKALQAKGEREECDAGGRTALHLAASYGCTGAVDALLAEGFDARHRDSLLNWTPLQYALAASQTEAAEILRKVAQAESPATTSR